jgi:hypothetical protein
MVHADSLGDRRCRAVTKQELAPASTPCGAERIEGGCCGSREEWREEMEYKREKIKREDRNARNTNEIQIYIYCTENFQKIGL